MTPVSTTELLERVRALVDDLHAQREAACHGRGLMLALLARLAAASGWPAGTYDRVIYIETPAGQLSWEYTAEEAPLFAALPEYKKPWDGHTTLEMHARIAGVITEIDRINAQLHGKD